MRLGWLVACAVVLAARLAAQDSAFRALQERGKTAMGVDQYTSAHRFDPLPDGGRIVLVRDSTDAAGVATIRAHLQHISRAFAVGEFAIPGFVHARAVPGTRVMAVKQNAIRYVFHPLQGGGEVRIVTRDSAAVRAVHEFLAFQRTDHRVGDRH
ncbi:MAG: hypothetical protein DMD41_04895 [Gemmatimonadetes bacterium]|nr:MAG: hypothetical protein DMD41_04895 [Gemmatimonadota bacterium]